MTKQLSPSQVNGMWTVAILGQHPRPELPPRIAEGVLANLAPVQPRTYDGLVNAGLIHPATRVIGTLRSFAHALTDAGQAWVAAQTGVEAPKAQPAPEAPKAQPAKRERAPRPTARQKKREAFAEGYQEALRDIATAYIRDGLKGTQEWLANNLNDDSRRALGMPVTAYVDAPEPFITPAPAFKAQPVNVRIASPLRDWVHAWPLAHRTGSLTLCAAMVSGRVSAATTDAIDCPACLAHIHAAEFEARAEARRRGDAKRAAMVGEWSVVDGVLGHRMAMPATTEREAHADNALIDSGLPMSDSRVAVSPRHRWATATPITAAKLDVRAALLVEFSDAPAEVTEYIHKLADEIEAARGPVGRFDAYLDVEIDTTD